MKEDEVRPSRPLHGSAPTLCGVFAQRMMKRKRSQVDGRKADRKALKIDGLDISPKEIEGLIDAAKEAAVSVQGRSVEAAATLSQEFHPQPEQDQAKHDDGLLEPKVKDLGDEICSILNATSSEAQCRSLPIVGKRDLFPLPISRCLDISPSSSSILQSVAMSLNSLNGTAEEARPGGSMTSLRALENLSEQLKGMELLEERLPTLNFDEFFRHKKVDYLGEEIQVAKSLSWKSIEPSLPSQVGQLCLSDFCEDGVLHFINNFENFLVAPEDRCIGKPPRVFVDDLEWEPLAKGLVDRGLCQIVKESDLCHINGKPLLNGMFSVSKQEFIGPIEICRLIMNLRPLNSISKALAGDTPTLPTVTSLGGIYLDEDQIITVSSEDVRCFFYLFETPKDWVPYMGFGRSIPVSMRPQEFGNERGFLAARVLPMGYLNSVGIAQHIHRNVIKKAMGNLRPPLGGEAEMRRDRVFPQTDRLIRVYLDNFDELKKVNRSLSYLIEGKATDLAEELREVYLEQGLPRHPKKCVESRTGAEVQGAWVNGLSGIAMAKPSKVAKYIKLGLELLKRGACSQRELQVIGGGFVYVSMFRRPLLSGLNQIWRSIVEMEGKPSSFRQSIKAEVVHEIARFIGLMPLAFINMRSPFDPKVTASDASTSGGGICVTRGLTPYGEAASLSKVRGDFPEEQDCSQILSVGLFDGIGGLRVALDLLRLPIAGHISVEQNTAAQRVVESFFPDTVTVEDVNLVTDECCAEWALKFGSVCLVLVGAGPPCQGVSGLNADRRGALRDLRSCLFKHVPRVVALLRKHFPWAQIHVLVENVGSMDYEDCSVMNKAFECEPWFIDSSGVSLCHRPRLYWTSWDLFESEGVTIQHGSDGRLPIRGEVKLERDYDEKDFLESGRRRADPTKAFPTFTTSRPSAKPMRKPAGLNTCSPDEVARWKEDSHRYPPYQYRKSNCLINSSGEYRTPSIIEREAILGFPCNYTKQCMKKQFHDTTDHQDCRKTLLGNSWSVPVVAWIISCLVSLLGFCSHISLDELGQRITPGCASDLQSLLLRPPLGYSTKTIDLNAILVKKLAGLTSLKGEDLLLQSQSDIPTKYHRLRSSVPAKLWRWSTVAGWQWGSSDEHINVLELRSVLTTVKWRIEQLGQCNLRFIHLVDSQVVLHALSRGRSSSRKMRRTLMRLCAHILACGLVPIWGYIDTKQNPADRPSRRFVKERWLKKQ